MELRTYPDREMQAIAVADLLAGALRSCLEIHPHASFCVPGGRTPAEMLSLLSDVDLDWARVHVFLTDERWVREDDARSNTALLRRTLLTGRAAAARLIPLVTDDATPEEGIPHLLPALEGEMPISVLLLGMGADGHTASLFPGGDRLTQALAPDAPLLLPMRAPGAPEPRVTLSARALGDAMATHVLIAGDDKRAALDRARGSRPDQAPVAATLGEAVVHWAP
jgi:6-phosphogluconolactonase